MRQFFLIGRILCLALYLAAILAWIIAGAWWWLILYLLLHLLEAMLFGVRIGSHNNKSLLYSLVSTMLFGLFWFVALEKGYLD